MRGKNILWLALVAMLLAVPSANVRAQSSTVISVDPPLTTGYLPGDTFGVNIMITGAVDLKSWQIEMSYAPYMSEISVIEFIEGDFLMIGGETYFAKYVDAFHGELKMGATIIGDVPGVSGDGWLGTIVFTVLEAGETPLALHDTILLDSLGNPIAHEAVSGYYLGPTADLGVVPNIYPRPKGGGHAQKDWMDTRRSAVGTGRLFDAQVVNTGYAPLDVRVKYTSVNAATGTTYIFYSGQMFQSVKTYRTEYVYVNEVAGVGIGDDWSTIGAAPYLNAAGDGNYIEATENSQWSSKFGFQDLTLGPLDKIFEVRLEGYTMSASLDIDFDSYDPQGRWYGSLWGTTAYDWHSPRWTSSSMDQVYPSIKNLATFNNFKMMFNYYTPDGTSMGPADLDCVRLKVTIETGGVVPTEPPVSQNIPAGGDVTPTSAIWYLTSADVGKWYTTVEVQYLYNYDPRFPLVWLYGKTTFTYEWWCYLPD